MAPLTFETTTEYKGIQYRNQNTLLTPDQMFKRRLSVRLNKRFPKMLHKYNKLIHYQHKNDITTAKEIKNIFSPVLR